MLPHMPANGLSFLGFFAQLSCRIFPPEPPETGPANSWKQCPQTFVLIRRHDAELWPKEVREDRCFGYSICTQKYTYV